MTWHGAFARPLTLAASGPAAACMQNPPGRHAYSTSAWLAGPMTLHYRLLACRAMEPSSSHNTRRELSPPDQRPAPPTRAPLQFTLSPTRPQKRKCTSPEAIEPAHRGECAGGSDDDDLWEDPPAQPPRQPAVRSRHARSTSPANDADGDYDDDLWDEPPAQPQRQRKLPAASRRAPQQQQNKRRRRKQPHAHAQQQSPPQTEPPLLREAPRQPAKRARRKLPLQDPASTDAPHRQQKRRQAAGPVEQEGGEEDEDGAVIAEEFAVGPHVHKEPSNARGTLGDGCLEPLVLSAPDREGEAQAGMPTPWFLSAEWSLEMAGRQEMPEETGSVFRRAHAVLLTVPHAVP